MKVFRDACVIALVFYLMVCYFDQFVMGWQYIKMALEQ
jgi:hypothetical protein